MAGLSDAQFNEIIDQVSESCKIVDDVAVVPLWKLAVVLAQIGGDAYADD